MSRTGEEGGFHRHHRPAATAAATTAATTTAGTAARRRAQQEQLLGQLHDGHSANAAYHTAAGMIVPTTHSSIGGSVAASSAEAYLRYWDDAPHQLQPTPLPPPPAAKQPQQEMGHHNTNTNSTNRMNGIASNRHLFNALQLEKLKACEENSLQPMTIMCQNAIPMANFPPRQPRPRPSPRPHQRHPHQHRHQHQHPHPHQHPLENSRQHPLENSRQLLPHQQGSLRLHRPHDGDDDRNTMATVPSAAKKAKLLLPEPLKPAPQHAGALLPKTAAPPVVQEHKQQLSRPALHGAGDATTVAATATAIARAIMPTIQVLPFKNPDQLMFLVEGRKPVDVLLGKSRRSKMHVGNVAFRALVDSRLELYRCNTRRSARIALCIAVTNAVYAAGGSFFAPQDKKCRTWRETDIDVARVKVGHAIRDNVKKLINGVKPKPEYEFPNSSLFTEIVEFYLEVMRQEQQLPAQQMQEQLKVSASTTTTMTTVPTSAASSESSELPSSNATTSVADQTVRKKIYSFLPIDGTLPASLVSKQSLPLTPSKKT